MQRIAVVILTLSMCVTCFAAQELKQSTAVTVKIGPFVEVADGVTPSTDLTIHAAHVRISKAGGNIAAKNDATAATHDEIGIYDCPLSTTDTATLGMLDIYVNDANCAYGAWAHYMVLDPNAWDAKYSTGEIKGLNLDSIKGNVDILTGTGATSYVNVHLKGTDDNVVVDVNATDVATGVAAAAINLDNATGSLADVQIDDDAMGTTIDEDDFLARVKALLPGGASGAVDPNSMTDVAWANMIAMFNGNGYAGGTIKLLVDVNLVDGEAPSTSADVTTAVWNSAVASYGGAGTYGQAVEDTLADTAALDSNTKLRTAMTGADTPVAKESTVAAISSDTSLLSGTAVVDGTHTATTRSFYVSTAFAETARALPEGTIIVVTDATNSLPYMGIVKSYSATRKVTLVTPLVITPANGDVVKIYPSIFQETKIIK
jgi:hypothetical protein